MRWLQFILVLAMPLGYAWGYGDGVGVGRQQERALYDARKDEHDSVMRKVGVCKWSKIMADDIRCKQELP